MAQFSESDWDQLGLSLGLKTSAKAELAEPSVPARQSGGRYDVKAHPVERHHETAEVLWQRVGREVRIRREDLRATENDFGHRSARCLDIFHVNGRPLGCGDPRRLRAGKQPRPGVVERMLAAEL